MEIVDSHEKKQFNIFKYIAGLSVIDCIFRTRKVYDEVLKDPLFINNLYELKNPYGNMSSHHIKYDDIGSELEKSISVLFTLAPVRCSKELIGNPSNEELNKNENGYISDDVLMVMQEAEEKTVLKKDAKRLNPHPFYMLTYDYSLSEVYKFSENPIFGTIDGKNIAIIDATEEEVLDVIDRIFITSADFRKKYNIVSLKKFNKDQLRKALLEIEYAKMDEILDLDIEEKNKERKIS